MTDRLRHAGRLQTLTLTVFLLAACLGMFALINGQIGWAAINAGLMVANAILYQRQSEIIRDEIERPS